jgi:hypothetical protein
MWHPQWYLTIARSLSGTQGEPDQIQWTSLLTLEYQIQFAQIYMVECGDSTYEILADTLTQTEGSQCNLIKQN